MIIHVLQRRTSQPPRLCSMSICRRCPPPTVSTVERPVLATGRQTVSSQRKDTIEGLRFMEHEYRYFSVWLYGTHQATVSWYPHRRHAANVPLVPYSNGADGFDMDYTDSKSIRPRSQVCTRLGWNPFCDSLISVQAVPLMQRNFKNNEILFQCGFLLYLHNGSCSSGL